VSLCVFGRGVGGWEGGEGGLLKFFGGGGLWCCLAGAVQGLGVLIPVSHAGKTGKTGFIDC
jgi:hypothetical protein